MKRLLSVAVLGIAASGALAQAVNKCTDSEGKVTYQVADCPKSAQGAQRLSFPASAPAVAQGKPPTSEVLEKNKKLCLSMLRHGVSWKDPDSIKLDEVHRLGSGPSMRMNGQTVIRYTTDVNGKNSYGGYTGNRLAICEFDLAETKVQHVHVVED